MSVYTNVKFQQISMRDLESAVNVRELNQSTIIKTFDSVSVSFFFILLADEHLIFLSWNSCEISKSILTTCLESN